MTHEEKIFEKLEIIQKDITVIKTRFEYIAKDIQPCDHFNKHIAEHKEYKKEVRCGFIKLTIIAIVAIVGLVWTSIKHFFQLPN